MNLRAKTFIFGFIIVSTLLIVLFYSSQVILLRSFTSLEEQSARRDVTRALEALNSEQENLKILASDYSVWDDTYSYINGENPNFPDVNLQDESLDNLKMNLVIIRNCSGEMLFKKGYRLTDTKIPSLMTDTMQALENSTLFTCGEDPNSEVSGLIFVDEMPILIASHSVIKSDSSGPANGVLVYGRILNQDVVQRLSNITNLSLSLSNISAEKLLSNEDIQVRPLDNSNIAGYGLVKDLGGQTILVLKVNMLREIYQQGQKATNYYGWSLAVAGLVFIIMLLILLEKFLVSRLVSLNKNVQQIGIESGLRTKLNESGKDEISSLAVAINKMVDAIEISEKKLRESERHNIIRAIPDLLFIMTSDGVIAEIRSEQEKFLNIPVTEIIGKNIIDIGFSEETYNLLTAAIEQTIATNETQVVEIDLSLQEEQYFEFRLVSLGKNEVLTILRDITERKQSEQAMFLNQETLIQVAGELEIRNREITDLGEMGNLFQACQTSDEAYKIITQYATRLFPAESGTLSIFNASRNILVVKAHWGQDGLVEPSFESQTCWGLRRGKLHIREGDSGVCCSHFINPVPVDSVCMPLTASGDILGVLSLMRSAVQETQSNQPGNEVKTYSEIKIRMIIAFAEHVGIALANLNLRETLRDQAIHDPLTGLYNRRFMIESLERELKRNERKGSSLGIVMFDIDHFKKFNDTYGHGAGDRILSELGKFCLNHMRIEDIACRYGGEEFILIFSETTLDTTCNRVEELRKGIKQMSVIYKNLLLGSITISFGIALYPRHGETSEILLRAADQALYRAKSEGRDRVVVAGMTGSGSQESGT